MLTWTVLEICVAKDKGTTFVILMEENTMLGS